MMEVLASPHLFTEKDTIIIKASFNILLGKNFFLNTPFQMSQSALERFFLQFYAENIVSKPQNVMQKIKEDRRKTFNNN